MKKSNLRKTSFGYSEDGDHKGLGLIHDFGNITSAKILSIVANENFVYVSDIEGNVKMIDLIDNTLSHCKQKLMKGRIISMA